MRHCCNPACDLRFPALAGDCPSNWKAGDHAPGFHAARFDSAGFHSAACPRCGAPVRITPYEAARAPSPTPARATNPAHCAPTADGSPASAPAAMCAVLDNLRSAFNVGSIFRVADGAGLARLCLCGYTPTPVQKKVAKTALGAEDSIQWSYHPNGLKIVAQLQAEGWHVAALETTPNALSIYAADTVIASHIPLALIVGNEITGIDPAILTRADWVLQIPMAGVKESLNVAVAFGIAAYWLQGVRQLAGPPSRLAR